MPRGAVYCVTKFAVRAIADGLRQEIDTIRVTGVNPGVVESELADTIADEATAGPWPFTGPSPCSLPTSPVLCAT